MHARGRADLAHLDLPWRLTGADISGMNDATRHDARGDSSGPPSKESLVFAWDTSTDVSHLPNTLQSERGFSLCSGTSNLAP